MTHTDNILLEQGQVVRLLKANRAKVRIKRHSKCIGCSQKSFCDPFGSEVMHLTAQNPVQAKEGEQVEVKLVLGSPKRSVAILYIFPLACLIFGAALGNILALFNNPDLSAALMSSFFLALSFLAIYLYAKHQARQNKSAEPTILRILEKKNPHKSAASAPNYLP